MPESPEVKIMSDFINHNAKTTFKKVWHVKKGNIPELFLQGDLKVTSSSKGKELMLMVDDLPIYVFMGMSGNWKYVTTQNWNDTKFTRLRLDDDTGHSLLLYGGYMGPKYSVQVPFGGTKRGPDPITDFKEFKKNIILNFDKKSLDKPISEAIMNQEFFNGVGAYLNSEIVGRLDLDPYRIFNSLSPDELNSFIDMIHKCCTESYRLGGGELKDWSNPFGGSKIDEWIQFYGNKEKCVKEKFGSRNIWIHKKWKK